MRASNPARIDASTMSTTYGDTVGHGVAEANPPLTKGPRVRPAAIATDPANAAPAPSCAGWSSRMAAATQAITIPAPTP